MLINASSSVLLPDNNKIMEVPYLVAVCLLFNVKQMASDPSRGIVKECVFISN